MFQRCRLGAGGTIGVAEVKCAGVDRLDGASWARASGGSRRPVSAPLDLPPFCRRIQQSDRMGGFAIPIAAPRGVEAWDVKIDRMGLRRETFADPFIWPTTQLIQSISGDYRKMTADDFFLVSIAFGGFLIFALVLWSFARIADRTQDNRRDPEIRPDVDSPGGANGHGKNEAARSGRPSDVLRRLASRTGIVRHRIDTYETVDAEA